MSSSVTSRDAETTWSPMRSSASDLRNGCSPPGCDAAPGVPHAGERGEHLGRALHRRCAACGAAPRGCRRAPRRRRRGPGPPCTRCGSGEPCPVEERASSRSSSSTRPLKAAMRRGELDRDRRVVRRDAGHERAAAARDERRQPRRACRSRGSTRPARTPRPRARPSARGIREPQQHRRRRTRRRVPRRVEPSARVTSGASVEPITSSPPAASSFATCRSTSSRCSSEASGPIVTPSARGSPTHDALGDARRARRRPRRRRMPRARSPAGSRCTSARPSSSSRPRAASRRRRTRACPRPRRGRAREALIESVSLVNRTPPVCTRVVRAQALGGRRRRR